MTHDLMSPVLDQFLKDSMERVDQLATTLRVMGARPEDALSVVAQTYLVILYDLFRPGMPYPGAFVNVVSSLAHATVAERREHEGAAH